MQLCYLLFYFLHFCWVIKRELFILTVNVRSHNFFFNVMYPFRVTFRRFMDSIQLLVRLYSIWLYYHFIEQSFSFLLLLHINLLSCSAYILLIFQNGFEFVPPDFDIWVNLISTDFVSCSLIICMQLFWAVL